MRVELLITPCRDAPRLKTGSAARGSGRVSGLGFDTDNSTRFRDVSATPRFLGVVANFQLLSDPPRRSPPIAPSSNARSSAQKARAIESLLNKGIEGSLPGMLSSKKA
jgi:hypothetical protein